MPRYLWSVSGSGNSCPSCAALNDHVHEETTWALYGLRPGAARLYCGSACGCGWSETEEAERGDLAAVPLRAFQHIGGAMPEQNYRVQLRASVQAGGRFEIAAITAGIGNEWDFTAAALEKSVALWEGAHVFVNHESWGYNRDPVRDLAGVFVDVRWDMALLGVVGTLRTVGPSGPLLEALGRELLAEDAPPADVGFSADVMFTAKGRQVDTIMRVLSLDLVFSPARGGAFLRALNAKGALPMPQQVVPPAAPPAANGGQDVATGAPPVAPHLAQLQDQLARNAAATQTLLDATAQKAALQKLVDQSQTVLAQQCAFLLDSALGASKLPEHWQKHVREQFAGKVFEAPELLSAIEKARELHQADRAGASVVGPGLIHQTFSSDDQLQAAVDDLFRVKRNPGLEGLKVARLGGIRELYIGTTGDAEFAGFKDPKRAQFSHGTADFASLVKNAMNKAIVERWAELGRVGWLWWQEVVAVEAFRDLKDVTWIQVGTINGDLPEVAEHADYTELPTGDAEETSQFKTYGGYVGISRKAIINDETRKILALPRELAFAGLRKISYLVSAVFTDNSGVGPTLADTGALFNSTAVTTLGGHANLLTTALGTDYVAWDAVSTAVYNQPMLRKKNGGYQGTGDKQAVEPTICLVPRALKAQAEALFMPRWQTQVESVATKGGPTFGGVVKPIVVPQWTDATDWAAVVDPMVIPGIGLGHLEGAGLVPEIFIANSPDSPAMFMNDELRIKVRHDLTVGVIDWRALHKSNVA